MTNIVRGVLAVVLSFSLVVAPIPSNVEKAEAVPLVPVAAGGALATLMAIYGLSVTHYSSDLGGLYDDFCMYIDGIDGSALDQYFEGTFLGDIKDTVASVKEFLETSGVAGVIDLNALSAAAVTGAIPAFIDLFAAEAAVSVPYGSFVLNGTYPINICFVDDIYPFDAVTENHLASSYDGYATYDYGWIGFKGSDGNYYVSQESTNPSLALLEEGLFTVTHSLSSTTVSPETVQLLRVNLSPSEPDTRFYTSVPMTREEVLSLVSADTVFYCRDDSTVRLRGWLTAESAMSYEDLVSCSQTLSYAIISAGTVSTKYLSENADVNLGLDWWEDYNISVDNPRVVAPTGADAVLDSKGNVIDRGSAQVIDDISGVSDWADALEEAKVGVTTQTLDGVIAENADVNVAVNGEVVTQSSTSAHKPSSNTSVSKPRNWPTLRNLIRQAFPFCLVLDVVTVLALFSAEPVTPYFEFPVKNFDGSTEQIVFDMASFEPLASTFRLLFQVVFLFGLIFVTLKFIRPDKGEDS